MKNMGEKGSRNKRIVRNTILLYLRMIFLLVVSLYTSRVFLDVLGVNDYGVYNVVGGVVTIFSIISSALYGAITRFIAFALGRNDDEKLNTVFCTSLNIQILLAFIIAILAEIIGLWFIYNKMTIDPERVDAATYVLHFSVATFMLNIVTVPYNACIIAHEKMSAFAYLSIIEVVLKLLIVYLLYFTTYDKLILYSFLLFLVALLNRMLFSAYCSRNFSECHYRFLFDRTLFKKMLVFSGWNFIGSTSFILRDQGINILINIYCGPAVNAARALSYRVFTSIQNFSLNFLTAITPQITKDYADNDFDHMHQLMKYGSKLAGFLLMIISIPVISQTDFILGTWLVEVPEHTSLFVQLLLIFSISEALSNPIMTAIDATGYNKKMQLYASTIQLLNLPLAWILLDLRLFPEITVVISIILSHIAYYIRLFLARKQCNINLKDFLIQVYFRMMCVLILSMFFSFLVSQRIPDTWGGFFVGLFLSLSITTFFIVLCGLNKFERNSIMKRIHTIFQNRWNLITN